MPDQPVRAASGLDDSTTDALALAAKRWLEGPVRSTLGCSIGRVRAIAGRVYVACGLGGVWLIEPLGSDFTIVERRDLGGNVAELFEHAGQLWAVVARTEARPIASLNSGEDSPRLELPADRFPRLDAPTHSDARPSPAPASPVQEFQAVEGRVVRVEGREVIVDLGTEDGIRPGTRVEFSKRGPHRAAAAELDDDAYTELAVGIVVSAGLRRARVALGMAEHVPLGAYARPTKAPITASTWGPARVGGVWEVSGLFRVFAALDEFGGGILLDAAAGYRFEKDLHLQARILPLGLASAEDGGIATLTAFVLANYDTHLFEIGAGLGAQTVNDPEFFEATGSGVVFPQYLRLGARDGVHLDFLSSAALFRKRFRFSGFRGSLQVPLSDAGWLVVFRGGGGISGHAFGELAVRALLRGNGRAGSTFLVAALGGAGLFRSANCDDFSSCERALSYAGPMFGLGLERRF